MPDTYDLSTDIGKVRLNITDTDVAGEHVFSDEEIQAFLDQGGTVFKATALALMTLATNEALVQKRIRLLDLSTDGPAVAAALNAKAKEYLALDAEAGEGFSYAEWVVDEFSRREKAIKDAMRDG